MSRSIHQYMQIYQPFAEMARAGMMKVSKSVGLPYIISMLKAEGPMAIDLKVNGKVYSVDVPKDMPLLWVLRDEIGLMGTKFGCGIGACGACTVMVGGRAIRSCSTVVGDVSAPVTTIEGIGSSENLALVQQAWIKHQVAQCGYCQSGQIVQAVTLLAANPAPTDAEIDIAMAGNLCRCGTYPRIRAAIKDAAKMMQEA